MGSKTENSLLVKVALISAGTAVAVFVVLAAIGAGIYYLTCCEPTNDRAKDPAGDGLVEKIERAGRSLTGGSTRGDKITSVTYSTWSHVGPLYPPPNEPPGYVSSSSVEFRRDLTARRESGKSYDRDLPPESTTWSATLTAEQFERLVAACVKNDIISQQDSKKSRSEGSSSLIIEYDGEKKSIVTSNLGQDTPEVADVLAVIKQLKDSANWQPSGPR